MLALLVTVAIWAAFALSARALSASSLRPADAALLRFGVPLVVLFPALWRRRHRIAAVRPGAAAKIICGAGVPFFLAAMHGGALTSAAFVGSIVPGMVPLFVSAIMIRRGHAVPRGTQAVGLALIAAGVAALVWRYVVPVDTDVLAGSGTLLVASGLWALYTVGLREVDLDPVGSIGLLCLPSFAVIGVLVLTGVLPTGIAHAAGSDIALFLVVQGLGVGLCAGLLYAFAIRRLGAERSSVVGSLSPVAVVLLAIPLLGEAPTVAVLVGVPSSPPASSSPTAAHDPRFPQMLELLPAAHRPAVGPDLRVRQRRAARTPEPRPRRLPGPDRRHARDDSGA
ncbi:DMT family transporter [Streptomyces sp. MS1.HAVA.3]|uniref:DMT family transporter n=1 Tax=Streptomyces caledonius TaxID=3134107 RepID=A0ABU8U177_9ACTN